MRRSRASGWIERGAAGCLSGSESRSCCKGAALTAFTKLLPAVRINCATSSAPEVAGKRQQKQWWRPQRQRQGQQQQPQPKPQQLRYNSTNNLGCLAGNGDSLNADISRLELRQNTSSLWPLPADQSAPPYRPAATRAAAGHPSPLTDCAPAVALRKSKRLPVAATRTFPFCY